MHRKKADFIWNHQYLTLKLTAKRNAKNAFKSPQQLFFLPTKDPTDSPASHKDLSLVRVSEV